jgi:putative ABC transport system permease protein
METLFGIPLQTLMWLFAGALVVILAVSVVATVREPVLLRLSLRNIPRRIGRAALIVIGLMLATTIISAALGTGDTIAMTMRTEVITSLGNIDEVVSAQEEGDIEVTGESSQPAYFDEDLFQDVQAAVADDPNVDGVMPVIWESAGVQNRTARQTEPRVGVFAPDPAFMDGFGTAHDVAGGTVTMAELSADEIYLNPKAADELLAEPGHQLTIYGPAGAANVTVRAIVDYEGAGTTSSEPGLMMPLARAQVLFQEEGRIEHIVISNTGDAVSGAELTDAVLANARPVIESLGLSVEATKQEDLQEADDAGDAFSSFFMTFGSFSIAAGIMLIFLIFVMLASERKPEMGISRAVGAERRHLVEMFAFEGLAYDVFAAAIGALLGVAVAWAMMAIVGSVLGDVGVEMRRATEPRSLITAYAMGVVLTFIVVTISAWRVSVLNIVTAIRNLPDPEKRTGRASLIWGLVFLAVGLLLAYAGYDAREATPFHLGLSLIVVSSIPFMRWFRVPDRVAFTVPAVVLLVWWVLPADVYDLFLPEMSADFNIFITSGLIIVTAATWIIMYNSDQLVRPALVILGRVRGLTPTLRTAISYPLANRFRTGMTLAMFMLVVFTLVVGAVITQAFTDAYDDLAVYGGGFDIRAETVRVNPIDDVSAAIASSGEIDPDDIEVVGDQSLVGIEARQVGTDNEFAAYPLRGVDDQFLDTTTYVMSALAEGYDTPEEVWAALKEQPGLAVVDTLPVPVRANFNFGESPTDFAVEGFYLEDVAFAPFDVEVRDPITGSQTTLTVIGVLQAVSPEFMIGLTTSQRLVEQVFPEQARPNGHLIRLQPGADAGQVADSLESVFLENGMEAVVLQEQLDDVLAVNRTFNYVVEGFLGLGLIVGVAALGVISARSVVERRHEIGVMRAIGFERARVELSILIESAMAALVGIVVGSALGIAIAFNIIRDTKSLPSWEGLDYSVPWLTLGIIFVIVLVAALVTAYVPARQASRVYPAEALRYE